jgi:hypothetical protein
MRGIGKAEFSGVEVFCSCPCCSYIAFSCRPKFLQHRYDFSPFFYVTYRISFCKMHGRDYQCIAPILKGLEDQVIGIGLKTKAHLALVIEGTAKRANVKIESFPVLALHVGLYRSLLYAFLFLPVLLANSALARGLFVDPLRLEENDYHLD